MNVGVPEESQVGSNLYLLKQVTFVSILNKVTIATFARNTKILAVDKNLTESRNKLQS